MTENPQTSSGQNSSSSLDGLSNEEMRNLLNTLKSYNEASDRDLLSRYTPYQKQIDFHANGLTHRERLFMAGNQLGKTLAGGFEMAMHLTGRYPLWWEGLRFDKAVRFWCGGKDRTIHRDAAQRMLLGDPENEEIWGTGCIPGDSIIRCVKAGGLANALDYVTVSHSSGGQSYLGFKTYDMRRPGWQGPTLDGIWFDEEPPLDIYTEGMTRTNSTLGPVFTTFTPLLGMSGVVSQFLQGTDPQKITTTMTIYDVDHYSDEEREIIINSYPPYERDARTKGIPMLGSGRVFPIDEQKIVVPERDIPDHWSQIMGLDFGWDHPFGAVHIAWDKDDDCVYITKCYKESEVVPLVHVAAIKAWGKGSDRVSWVPCAWPHDGYQHDKGSGLQLSEIYREHGLNMMLEHATHEEGGIGTEAGVIDMLERMQTGRLKVFAGLEDWFSEFRMYHRLNAKIVKENDDLMSATRIAIMMLRESRTMPVAAKIVYEDGIYA